MGIVFFCQSCGARFEVDPRMAGKKGRCKKCGQHMTIPRAEQIASMAAMPALATAGVGAGGAAAVPAPLPAAHRSGPGSRPVSARWPWHRSPVDRIAVRQKKPQAHPLDDAEDSKPYVLAQPVGEKRGRVQGAGQRRPERLEAAARQGPEALPQDQPGRVPVSVPFLMILLLGTR